MSENVSLNVKCLECLSSVFLWYARVSSHIRVHGPATGPVGVTGEIFQGRKGRENQSQLLHLGDLLRGMNAQSAAVGVKSVVRWLVVFEAHKQQRQGQKEQGLEGRRRREKKRQKSSQAGRKKSNPGIRTDKKCRNQAHVESKFKSEFLFYTSFPFHSTHSTPISH